MAERPSSKHLAVEVAKDGNVVEETTPLLGSEQDAYRPCSKSSQRVDSQESPQPQDERSVLGIMSVLLIGIFVASADTSLVMATFAEIASDFDSLESGSWLLSSFSLAACATGPLVSCESIHFLGF